MNDTCEMWSLPWHALQRNLALGLGGDAPAADATVKAVGATIKAVNVQSTAAHSSSWLGRARLRAAPLSQQARQ